MLVLENQPKPKLRNRKTELSDGIKCERGKRCYWFLQLKGIKGSAVHKHVIIINQHQYIATFSIYMKFAKDKRYLEVKTLDHIF
jgi:hypothetical protein